MKASWITYAKFDPYFFQNRKIIRAGRNGRDVFLFAICVNAQRGAQGWIPLADLEPWYVASQLRISEIEASAGIGEAEGAGLLRVDGDRVYICGWDEDWARRAKLPAEKQSDYRERKKKGADNDSERYRGPVTSYPALPVLPIDREIDRERDARNGATDSLSLPDGFEPSERARGLADKRRLDLAHELAQFRDKTRASAKQSSDWDASFCAWLRQSKDVDRKPDKPMAPKARGGAYVSAQRNGDTGATEWVLTEADGNARVVGEDEAKKHAGYKPPKRAHSSAGSAAQPPRAERSEGARRTGES